jgi:hypothetical protein
MQKASCSCADLDSVEFWSLLAFPMALLLWYAHTFAAANIMQPIFDKTQQVGDPLRDVRPHPGVDQPRRERGLRQPREGEDHHQRQLSDGAGDNVGSVYVSLQANHQPAFLGARLKTDVCQVRRKFRMGTP